MSRDESMNLWYYLKIDSVMECSAKLLDTLQKVRYHLNNNSHTDHINRSNLFVVNKITYFVVLTLTDFNVF